MDLIVLFTDLLFPYCILSNSVFNISDEKCMFREH